MRSDSDDCPADMPPGDGQGTVILLVDDDPHVRGIAARVLAKAGYAVLEAGDGVEALEVLESAGAGPAVGLLLTDVQMPRMDGRELGQLAAERWPDLSVLYMSGHDSGPGRGLPALTPLVPKPFLPAELLEAVRSRLAGGG
jgi:two-component system cell cycle sensor histidine kinase/response regulator CckA